MKNSYKFEESLFGDLSIVLSEEIHFSPISLKYCNRRTS
ncbi:hypothetical protein NRS6167_06570 [Bacillus subtilis]|nr:hypothetical protein NRS6167_01717 [Bacillus subtilis]CAI6248532.1 hypothetical protein NRS6167_06570 [Bacillus subtilis]